MGFNPFVGSGNGGGGSGTDNYNLLSNKPKVNGVELKGNKSLVDLGILFGSSLVAEIDSSTYIVTLTLKDQEGNTLGEPQSLDLPLESVVVGGRYDDTTKKVILTLQNGNTVEFSVADLVAGLQSELSSTNKLNPEFINYNSTHRAVSDAEKSTWNGKQNALTFDNTPTNGSSNPVKSGGVYAALENKVDKVDGKGLSTNDFNNEDKAALVELVDAGAKNLLKNVTQSQTVGGVTFTLAQDGSITANGTKTNNDWLYLSMGNTLPAGSYVLSSGLDPQENSSVRVLVATADSLGAAIISTEGKNQVAKKTFSQSYSGLIYAIRISSGYTVSNLVFKPMLCTAEAYAISPEFVPYAPTNRELFENKTDKAETAAIVNVGAKNVLNVTATSKEVNGITFTVNDDNSVTINGTATARAQFQLAPSALMPNLQGYILNGAVVNDSGAAIKFQYSASPWTSFANDSGNGAVIGNYNNANSIAVFIDVPNGATVNNLVFKPMIRNPNIEDDTYVPYGMTNVELTDSVESNKAGIGVVSNRGSKNQLDVSQTPSSMNAGNITITKGADGSLTLNGTSSATVSDVLIGRITLPAGDYVLSGCAEGGAGGTWLIRIYGDRCSSSYRCWC